MLCVFNWNVQTVSETLLLLLLLFISNQIEGIQSIYNLIYKLEVNYRL
jgi:hypothetical protein